MPKSFADWNLPGFIARHNRTMPTSMEDDRLRVLEGRCPNLLTEASMYRWGEAEDRRAEVPVDKDNHGADSLRYACRYVAANLSPGQIHGPYHVPPAEPLLPAYLGGGYGSATGW